jgi:hypothetical protein
MSNLQGAAIWTGIALISSIVGLVIILINKNKNKDKKEIFIKDIEEERTVIDQKLIVFNKTHESLGTLTELEIGTKYFLCLNADLGRFYKVRLANGEIGFIIKQEKNT